VSTLREENGIVLLPQRVAAMVTGALGVVGLLLASVGLYGIIAYTAGRRTREIGIRVALGAAHEDVLKLIVRQGMRPVIVGIAIGLAGAAAASTVLANMLFGLSPRDPVSFVVVPVVFLGIALAACYIPARRALRIQPTIALRSE
jgi:ABC-type antimicrobial peptide transport system permease subunit